MESTVLIEKNANPDATSQESHGRRLLARLLLSKAFRIRLTIGVLALHLRRYQLHQQEKKNESSHFADPRAEDSSAAVQVALSVRHPVLRPGQSASLP